MGRMQALARAYELLSRDGWRRASMSDLIGSQLAAFATEGARCSMQGDAIELNSNAALALGLVVYELATNAIKYGSLSVPGGRVDVSWKMRKDGESEPTLMVTMGRERRAGGQAADAQRFRIRTPQSAIALRTQGRGRNRISQGRCAGDADAAREGLLPQQTITNRSPPLATRVGPVPRRFKSVRRVSQRGNNSRWRCFPRVTLRILPAIACRRTYGRSRAAHSDRRRPVLCRHRQRTEFARRRF